MNPLVRAGRAVVQYFQGAYQELRRVTWPNRPTVIRYTIIVLVTVVVGIGALTVFDHNLQRLTEAYLLR